MERKKQPVTIWGIEFDALIDEQKTLSSTIPVYPVEEGFPVSDTIINNPVSINLSLYISNTPVTWLYRHGTAPDRVTAQKVRITRKETVEIPSYILKSGETMANAGKTSTSTTSSKSSISSASSTNGSSYTTESSYGSNSSSNKGVSEAKKNQSILYGAASGLGLI